MDLSARLRGWALARPRVLLVDTPGATPFRWAVEADLDRRGWSHARSPADTDLLVVLGPPGPGLAAAVEVLWSQVPEPRHRVDLRRPDDIGAALDEGGAALIRPAGSGPGADDRPSPAELLGTDGDAGHEGMDHGGGHEGMDHGGGHEGMDHGGEVAGLPMAMTGPDRDGLELDVLTVVLGPVLPGWPTGLVLRAELQGDVLTSAELCWLDAASLPAAELDLDPQQAALDRLVRFLVVAGWPTAARDARRARDGFSAGDPDRRVAAQRRAAAVARRVRRSRALAWTAGGIGCTAPESGLGGDTLDRVRRWCEIAVGQPVAELAGPSLDEVAALVQGAELGSARLIVAGFDLQPVTVVPPSESAHA
ncbi:hypothetical protein [Modestobacter lapidis]|nr:hypothetical protein [Modestobacter lapidis]